MIVSHVKDVQKIPMNAPGVLNAMKQVLIGPSEGWDGYVMRVMTLEKQGYSPRHTHSWPHINYVLKGQGTLFIEDKEYVLEAGSFAYVPGNVLHQYRSTSDEDFVFICIVPEEGDK